VESYGIGGYGEHRTIYRRSKVFDSADGGEARRLHLGIDIWGKPYTKVMAPLDGIVHSFSFNNAFGDYGATIILTHNLEGETFHTLYGHLSLNSIKNIQEGDRIRKGDVFTEFGIPFENGQWPPHLHFQLVIDMEGKKGDYPGVCKFSEREKYLANCPDPDLILQMMQYVAKR
ncbi:MAG: peptidoglycan DD-metalloendopeptidase family protein, partial [Flavisolibacter sp.]|nr:peptidoglycan DD-metalloendopeptidase family protein [Flavisolibacter sp.]